MKKLFSILVALIFSVCVSFASTEYPDFTPGSVVESVQKHIDSRDTYLSLAKNNTNHSQDYIALAAVQQQFVNADIAKVKSKLNYHNRGVETVKQHISYLKSLAGDHTEEIRQFNSVLVYHREQIIICSNELAKINKLPIEMKY